MAFFKYSTFLNFNFNLISRNLNSHIFLIHKLLNKLVFCVNFFSHT